jgi:hypothetical protein
LKSQTAYDILNARSKQLGVSVPLKEEVAMSGRSLRLVSLYLGILAALAGFALAIEPGDVVINEMYCDPNTYYDTSEFIELYNTTDQAIDLSGWVLTGVEFDQICQEHHHQLPSGTTIAAHGYLVIARDVVDNTDHVGFEEVFHFLPDLEMYDSQTGYTYEYDDPRVPNTICQNPDSHDDQIRLVPGTGDYGGKCPEGGQNRNYEALWLFSDINRTNLIDVVEYKDPYWCTTDHCTGIGSSDTDAFAEWPGGDSGLGIGRDANSTDTDISQNDLYLQVPTPGARNNVNVPPDIWGLAYSPCVPYETDDVTVSCYIKDPDGIQWAYCYYSFDGGAWDSVAITASPGDSLYTGDLPAQPLDTHAEFFVKAADDSGLVKMHPDTTQSNPYRYRVGMTLISQVQTVPIGGDTSSYIGQAVNLTGVVTASRGIYYNDGVFAIQDGRGPFSGIYVFDPTYSVDAQEGDSVTVSGFVSEYYGLTELYMFVGCYTEYGPGTIPDPTVVTTGTISTSSNLAERYEGVLVQVDDVTVTSYDPTYGEWEVNDGSGAAIVDDDAYYAYEPVVGDPLGSVIGVLNHYRTTSYEGYRIEPRRSADIVGPPSIWGVVYSPIPPTNASNVVVSATVKDYNFNITAVKTFYSTDDGASWDSTAMSSPDSVYTGNIGTFANGTTVDYYIEAWNDGGYVSHKPPVGSYDLYVGTRTIYAVQSNFKPGGGDSSLYAGQPVNLSGIVTAAPGEFSPYYFFIENSHGAAESPAYDGIKVYDRTGTVVLSRGDSVTVCGDVWENFLETELALHFSGAVSVNSTGNAVPQPWPVSTASVNTSEDWEGVLVATGNSTVKRTPNKYGEWTISDGAVADTCIVSDTGSYVYDPLLGDLVNVKGVVVYAYGNYMIEPRDDDDICEPSEAGVTGGSAEFRLALGFTPNPVTSGADIRMAIPVSGEVSLKIYDVQGRLVSKLLDDKVGAGEHTIHWSGSNSGGNKVASGIYFMKLDTRQGSLVKKMVISR